MVIISALVTSIIISIAISAALTVASMLIFPKQTPQRQSVAESATPKPVDGAYNLKQNVPSLCVVLGRVKKAGDYVFLEERQGIAYHIIVNAAHQIEGYVTHYFNDEALTLTGNAVTAPDHFVVVGTPYQGINEKLGLPLQTSNGLESVFPEIWSAAHRGDGLAYVTISVVSTNQERQLTVYPQGMPSHSVIMDGALLYDPRDEYHDPDDPTTWTFSTNLALMRLFHLTHPSGGKLAISDLYLPDWIEAADVCDEVIENRDAVEEPRYHGGMFYRYENDPVQIGLTLDQAADLVIYETESGLVGVHAGRMITPDIRITADDMQSFHYDANRRAATTVLAVRGRWTDPDSVYNTVDAAIFGNPYIGADDTQRTKTVDNAAVQRHNHCQRLQKLAFIRANAARVTIKIDYDATSTTRNIAYRRFVRVDYPSRGLDEAIVEITGRPKLSLSDLTITFDGIVVPSTLYNFNAATEEGEPGGIGEDLTPVGVPVPTGLIIGIASEMISGGQTSAFARATWDFLSDALTYELQYQLSDESEVSRSVMSKPSDTEVRTDLLQDGAEYQFRLRAWSNNVFSDWTDYETATAVADAAAPGQPTSFTSNAVGSDVTLDWINPNSPNLYKTELYRGGTSSFGSAVLIFAAYGSIAEPRSYVDASLSSGTYYWWVRSTNASGVASTEVGPQSETI